MLKAIIQITILLFIFLPAKSQDLSGTWEGSGGSGAAYWRIGIIQVGDSCFGYSYDSGPGFCKVNFVATYNSKDKKFKGKALNFISSSFGHSLIVVNMQYEKYDGKEFLSGTIGAKSLLTKILSFGIGSYGQLKKISNEVDTTVYMSMVIERLKNNPRSSTPGIVTIDSTKKDTIVKVPAPVVDAQPDSFVIKKAFEDSVVRIKESRNSIVVKTISTAADSVTIILYDDGEIDGDIVTVFDNGKIIVNKLSLTKEPFKATIALPFNNSKHTIELMAENEGSIPPNTAYMLVLAGAERVEVKASSDKLSNAAIVIQKTQ